MSLFNSALNRQIQAAQAQILNHQQQVDSRTTTLIHHVQQQMTAPATLLLAGGVGFIVGELSKCPTLRRAANQSQTAEKSPVKIALQLITSARTLYTALPIAWFMKSRYQPPSPPHYSHKSAQTSRTHIAIASPLRLNS